MSMSWAFFRPNIWQQTSPGLGALKIYKETFWNLDSIAHGSPLPSNAPPMHIAMLNGIARICDIRKGVQADRKQRAQNPSTDRSGL